MPLCSRNDFGVPRFFVNFKGRERKCHIYTIKNLGTDSELLRFSGLTFVGRKFEQSHRS